MCPCVCVMYSEKCVCSSIVCISPFSLARRTPYHSTEAIGAVYRTSSATPLQMQTIRSNRERASEQQKNRNKRSVVYDYNNTRTYHQTATLMPFGSWLFWKRHYSAGFVVNSQLDKTIHPATNLMRANTPIAQLGTSRHFFCHDGGTLPRWLDRLTIAFAALHKR